MINIFVIDTNTILSSIILPNSVPKKAFLKAQKLGNIVFSEATFLELDEVIRRTKFDKYIAIENRLLFLNQIKESALYFEITTHVSDCRDPKDNKFLELALAAQPSLIISGDKDLLDLNPYHGISIISLADFIADSQ